MIVYRVEHTTAVDDRTMHACGPCADVTRFSGDTIDGWDRAYEAQYKLMRVMNGRDDKPSPFWDDELEYIHPNEICGVDSEESLRFWFEDALPALEEVGFAVRRYDVPDWACRVGRSGQVLFQYGHATLVDEENTGE